MHTTIAPIAVDQMIVHLTALRDGSHAAYY